MKKKEIVVKTTTATRYETDWDTLNRILRAFKRNGGHTPAHYAGYGEWVRDSHAGRVSMIITPNESEFSIEKTKTHKITID